jgi:hypothetical protein
LCKTLKRQLNSNIILNKPINSGTLVSELKPTQISLQFSLMYFQTNMSKSRLFILTTSLFLNTLRCPWYTDSKFTFCLAWYMDRHKKRKKNLGMNHLSSLIHLIGNYSLRVFPQCAFDKTFFRSDLNQFCIFNLSTWIWHES